MVFKKYLLHEFGNTSINKHSYPNDYQIFFRNKKGTKNLILYCIYIYMYVFINYYVHAVNMKLPNLHSVVLSPLADFATVTKFELHTSILRVAQFGTFLPTS